ncbi:MAG: hypothetical protein Q8P84_00705 [Deltaproteobacteria bacterium]|nr:hypothetical protein [Deltaproteobacteria bacterium]
MKILATSKSTALNLWEIFWFYNPSKGESLKADSFEIPFFRKRINKKATLTRGINITRINQGDHCKSFNLLIIARIYSRIMGKNSARRKICITGIMD